MDGCALASLIPSADQVETFLAVLGTIVTAASALAAATPTPAPGTRAARLYRYLEIAALLVGRAKETGPPVPPFNVGDSALPRTRMTIPPPPRPPLGAVDAAVALAEALELVRSDASR